MEPRNERVFMVRMWQASERDEAAEWRGSVRDVSADQTYYVVGTQEIGDFIAGALRKQVKTKA